MIMFFKHTRPCPKTQPYNIKNQCNDFTISFLSIPKITPLAAAAACELATV